MTIILNRRVAWTALVFGSLLFLPVLFALPASAAETPQAGVASAVRGEVSRASAARPGTAQAMAVGQNIFMQDRIKSAARSQAQLLMLDQSSFTVGPDSDLVIDEFVYDPASDSGKLVASVARGTFRFVSGGIGRLGADKITIRTKLSTIGIRGTIVLRGETRDASGNLTAETIILAGPGAKNNANAKPGQITVSSAGRTVTVFRTGWGTQILPGQPPTLPAPITPAAMQQVNKKLTAAAPQTTTPAPSDVVLESDEAGEEAAETTQTATLVQTEATVTTAVEIVTTANRLPGVSGAASTFCCFSGFGIFNNLGQEVSDLAAVHQLSSGIVSASATDLPLVDVTLVTLTGDATGGALNVADISALPVLGTYDYKFTADLSSKTYTITASGVSFLSGDKGSISRTTTFSTSGVAFLDFSVSSTGVVSGPGVTHVGCDPCSLDNDLLTIDGNPVGGISHQLRAVDDDVTPAVTLYGTKSLLTK